MFQGEWWIPGQENHRVSGVLVFKENEIELQIVGHLIDSEYPPHAQRIKLIHGIVGENLNQEDKWEEVKNKYIIVETCLLKRDHRPVQGGQITNALSTTVYWIGNVYVIPNDCNIKSLELTFDKIEIEFSHLFDFARLEGRSISEKLDSNQSGKFWELEEILEPVTYPSAKIKDTTLEINYTTVQRTAIGEREFSVHPRTAFRLSTSKPRPLNEWKSDFITPLLHFLILATDKINLTTKIRLYNEKNQAIYFEGEPDELNLPLPIELIDREIISSSLKEFERAFLKVFSINEVMEDFENIMQTWFTLYEKHDIVQNLLFGTLIMEQVNIEDRFLNLARALEVFHREKYPNYSTEDSQNFKKQREKILVNINNDEDKKWLKEKLHWVNQISFENRLNALLAELDGMGMLNDLKIKKETVAAKIRKERNHLTHYGKLSREIPWEDIVRLSHFMEYMLKSLLLNEIDIPPLFMKKTREYKFNIKNL